MLPLVGMTVAETDISTENRTLSEWPAFVKEGRLNRNYLQEVGAYFNDHFAFRNDMVAANALIMSNVFGQSAVDTVLTGTDHWLYYTDSLDDYLGQEVISEREAYHIAHNLEIVQKKLKQKNIEFAFTIAPNKNSLYDDHMPYYYRKKAGNINNRVLVEPLLEKLSVSYINLYEAFEKQDEVLYRKQDSHWNEKGAVLAYNTILDALGREHEDYSDAEIIRVKTEEGDLATALYSVAAEPEWDYRYIYESNYIYTTETKSWEDVWIQTESPGKKGNLLMFRDSFGNTLSPLLAEEYGKAAFSKDTVYHLDASIEQCYPDFVLFEIVERNLERFGEFSLYDHSCGPPVMEAPYAYDLDVSDAEKVKTETTLNVNQSDLQTSYLCLSGQIDEAYQDVQTNVYIEIISNGKSELYEAYTVSDPYSGKDNGFMMYLAADQISGSTFQASVFAELSDGTIKRVLDETLNLDEMIP